MLIALIAVAGAAIVCLPAVQAAGSDVTAAAAETQKAVVQTEKAVAEVTAKAQSVCAVCGNPINKEIFSDVDGKRVYFCCAACKAKFDADSKTYLEKMQKDGITPEAIPAAPAAK
jgi:YHS domain-containing protein